jgi:hypothetical protein
LKQLQLTSNIFGSNIDYQIVTLLLVRRNYQRIFKFLSAYQVILPQQLVEQRLLGSKNAESLSLMVFLILHSSSVFLRPNQRHKTISKIQPIQKQKASSVSKKLVI